MSEFVEDKIESARTHPTDFSWSQEDYEALFERLEREAQADEEELRRQAQARAWELAKQQGVKPIGNIEDLQGDFWPEEESVDEFLDWVQAIRHQDRDRSELE